MNEQISIEEAHQIAGELLFSYKLLEKRFKQTELYYKELLDKSEVEKEQLKGEIFQLKKELNGSYRKGDVGQ